MWSKLQKTAAWRILRRSGTCRSALYLGIELVRTVNEEPMRTKAYWDHIFARSPRPFTDNNDRVRFVKRARMLDLASNSRPFRRALEIGCAEGEFTKILPTRCHSLVVADISPAALAKTRQLSGLEINVCFYEWDLRHDPLPGPFDLIVVGAVLEYLYGVREFRSARTKLVSALCGGGYMLIDNTRQNVVAETAWWGRLLIRGAQINRYFYRDVGLRLLAADLTGESAITLFQKTTWIGPRV